ncbi:MAG: DUF445 domain-containing protein [Firmicutes bacterium]|nr:DUF445 domain-containing protein [Bacillota bacterium]
MQRRWANVSLMVLAGLLAIALLFHRAVWSPYLLGLSLAGLAGAIADWYAVTALFRHPLGLKWLPHTSIISANRDRIIDAISHLVETELLSAEYLNRYIQKISVSELVLRQLGQPLSPEIGRWLSQMASDWINRLDVERIAAVVEETVTAKADQIMLSDWLVRLIEWLIRSGNDRALFLFLSQHAEQALDQVELTQDLERRLKEMIDQYTKTGTQKFFLGLLESLGTVDYHELSLAIKSALKRWLESDEAFQQFDLVLVRILRSLRDDAVVRARVEEAKMGLLGQVPWPVVVAWGKDQLVESLRSGQAGATLERGMASVKQWLEGDLGYQAQLDALARGLLMRMVTQYHSVIGRLVHDNLSGMDEREWIDKLEYYVGRDLQWIRINGAVVGALVGLVITVLTHL